MKRPQAPTPLAETDDRAAFTCGVAGIDEWFHRQAYRNHSNGNSRVFVSRTSDGTIAGFYALSMNTVSREDAGRLGNGAPAAIPVVLIGKLAVSAAHQGRGLGTALLRDAVLRAVNASESVGSAAILVHTMDTAVVPFYEAFGFTRLGADQSSLILPMSEALATVRAAGG